MKKSKNGRRTIPTIKKRKITCFGHMIIRNIHMLILEGHTYQRMDGDEIQIPRETGSRSGAMIES